MKVLLISFFQFTHIIALSQGQIDPSKLPVVHYKPKINVNGIKQQVAISFDTLMKYGLQVVLDDKSFKVVQFDIGYDCHSKAVFDFSVQRYSGDKVNPTDVYFKRRILAGDVIDIANTVIENNGYRYEMKTVSYSIVK
ncbi:MAG: hypothetical protein ABI675_11405 [Chitinophagaceae bacterium]